MPTELGHGQIGMRGGERRDQGIEIRAQAGEDTQHQIGIRDSITNRAQFIRDFLNPSKKCVTVKPSFLHGLETNLELQDPRLRTSREEKVNGGPDLGCRLAQENLRHHHRGCKGGEGPSQQELVLLLSKSRFSGRDI